MGAPHQQFIDIDECITAYMDEAELSVHKQFKLSQLAFRCMDELGLDFFYQIQSTKQPVNANLTVTLPGNCLRVAKCGVLNDKGEVIPLNSNDKLTTYADLLPNRIAKTQDDTLFNWYSPANGIFYNYWNGNTFGNLYGLPSGSPFVGSYKVDEHNGVILLSENFAYPYVILECLVSPAQGETYYVPIQFKEAIIAYLSWKDIKSMPTSRKGNLGDKRDRRADYYNERRLAIARYRPFRTQDAYQQNLESQRLTVKA